MLRIVEPLAERESPKDKFIKGSSILQKELAIQMNHGDFNFCVKCRIHYKQTQHQPLSNSAYA